MYRPTYGDCRNCIRKNVILPVKSGLCQWCNEEQKKAKKSAAGKNTTPYKYKRTPTGEKDVFNDISEERPWVCFVTGVRLPYLTATSFLHVLPKAQNKFPLFKLNPKNIVLGTDEIHDRWDKAPRSSLIEPYWQKMFDLEAELLKEYSVLKERNKLL